jgi:hypothetical protein
MASEKKTRGNGRVIVFIALLLALVFPLLAVSEGVMTALGVTAFAGAALGLRAWSLS